jgi:uncharacterized membrane protein YfhO
MENGMERKRIRRIMAAAVDVVMLPFIVLLVTGCGWAVKCNLFFMGGVKYFASLFWLYFSMERGWIVPAAVVIWLVFLWARHCIGFTLKLWGLLWKGLKPRTARIMKPLLLVGILTVAALAVVYGQYLSGSKFFMFNDLGFDTTIQFYPMYIWVIHSIREGSLSLWNFAWGLGCDTLTRQEWLMDPFGILTVISGLLFGDGVVRYVLIWFQALKIVLAIFFCYKYISFFGFDWKVKSVVSWMYGFNGYMLLWGEHYYFGAAVVYVVLLLYAVERYLKKQDRGNVLFVSLLIAAIFIYSGYFGYMIVLFGSVYALLRIGWVNMGEGAMRSGGFKGYWRLLWPLVLAVVIGIAIAGVLVLPFVELTVSVSSRLSNDLTFLQKLKRAFTEGFDFEYYGALFSRLATNNMMGKGIYQDYYEYPQLSFSMMNLIVLPQFLFMWFRMGSRRAALKGRRLLQILAVLLVVLSLVFPFASYAFNGFGTISERWTFVLMPLWAYCYAYFLTYLKERGGVSVVLLIASLAAVCGLGYWCFWQFKVVEGAELNVNSWILYFNVFCVVGLALYSLCGWRNGSALPCGWCGVGLTLAILSTVSSVVCEGYVCNVMRSANTAEYMNDTGNGETMQALGWIQGQDESFYRVEKDYSDLMHTSDSFIQGYYPYHMYCSSKSGELIDFYEYIYSDTFGEETVNFEMDQDMVGKMALVNVKYYLSRDAVDYENLELVNEVAGVKIYENRLAASVGTLWNRVMSRSDYEALDADGRVDAILKYLIVDDAVAGDMQAEGTLVYNAGDVQATGALTSGGDFRLVSQTCIEGTINNTSGKSWLMLSIPWRKGWNVYVDGEKANTVKVDYAFMAVSVDSGEHDITVRYENPIYFQGLLVSVAGCVMLAVYMFFYGRKSSESGGGKHGKIQEKNW